MVDSGENNGSMMVKIMVNNGVSKWGFPARHGGDPIAGWLMENPMNCWMLYDEHKNGSLSRNDFGHMADR